MRVIHFTLDFPYEGKAGVTTKGGAGACVMQLCNGLHKQGIGVTVIAGKHSDYKKEIVPYEVIRVPNLFFGVRESKAFGIPLMTMIPFSSPFKFDIVHAHNPPGFLAAYLFAKCKNKPILLTMHGPWSDLRGTIKPIAKQIEKFALTHADEITNDSFSLTKRLNELYKVNGMYSIQNAIETDKFKPGSKEAARKSLKIPSKTFVVLYTGRFVREKHVDDLLYTLRHTTKEIENLLYLLVGGGFDQKLVTDWIEKYPEFKDNIKIIPFMPPSKMPELYNAADVFVLPTEAEGMSRSLLEAMSMGMPTITTNIEANCELIDFNRGLMYELGNTWALSRAIIKMYSDKLRRNRYAKASREHVVKNHSVEARVEKFIKLYRKMIQCE